MRIRTLALSLLVAVTSLAGSSDRFPYVFKRGGGGDWVRVNGSIESFKKIQKRFSGEYIWISRNGRESSSATVL